jgi:single-strand DNA-binding protein
MGFSVNEVTLAGRLGRDPEIRYTEKGAGVANLALATDENWKDKTTGEKQTLVTWHKLVSWISIPFIEQYLHKGDLIYVRGKIQTREWTDKDGGKKSTTEINVLDIKPVSTARVDGQGTPPRQPAQQQRSTNKPAPRQQAAEVSDEDIPF